jgi:hypothetical protein
VVARYKDVEMVIVGAGFGVAPTTVQRDVTAVATKAYVRYIRAACG